MAQEAARSLPISDLLRVLNQKLGLESSKLRGAPLPPIFSASSLESEIDSLEARTQDVLRLIPSLRNLLRPVNRLPPEILSHIAQYLIGDYDVDATSVVPLTHVCRYWRESIISTPGNWTLVSSKNEDMTVVCLQRAKRAPLKITLILYPPLGSSFPDIFAPHLQTIRTLAVIFMSSIGQLMSMFPDFPQSMPSLRSLELNTIDALNLDQSIDPFNSSIPALERLVLEDIPLYPSLLGLATLTELAITHEIIEFDFHLDTLLDFLEENPALERVTLEISFTDPPLLRLRRQTAMRNQLRYLRICTDKMNAQALISNIPLQRGADLDISLGEDVTLNDFLPDISTAHLSNPPSPTFFQLRHGPFTRGIILDGPGGRLSFCKIPLGLEVSFADLAVLPLANVREVHLHYHKANKTTTFEPPVFYPSYFPALEVLTIDCNLKMPDVLSVLLSNSPPSPFLKTIGFLDCDLSEDFMARLAKFASERQSTPTSIWLYRVQIVHREGAFPSAASIRRLRKYVKVVETRIDDKFSTDLM